MPNVAPRGLFGNVAGAWKPALSVLAVLDGETAFTPAKFVYAWCAATNKWEVIWGKDISKPLTVTAAYLTDGTTSVKVDWTLPTPNVAWKWRVRRPDGSVVGDSASSTVTTMTDLTPLAGIGTYTVSGIDQLNNESAQVASNSLDINLKPATATATLVGDDLKVDWTLGPQGQPDGWMVWDAINAVWASGQLAGTARSFTVTGLSPGNAYWFAVYPFISGWVSADGNRGTNTNTASTGIPANVPTSVTLAAINPPATGAASADQIQLSWVAPTGGVTAYEVESSTNGTTWTASTDDASPVVFVSSVALYARVRTTSPGGVSAWVQKGPVSPYADSPPGVPGSVVQTALTSPLSTMRLTWTAGTGATAYQVEYSTNNSTWTASADDVSPSDWNNTTAVNGYMRVRSTSPGGSSAWVSKGPVAFVHDTTPPTTPVITSWKPESSYGRMVCRFTTAASADINSYRCDYRTDSGSWVTGSWTACNPSTAIAWVCPKTFVATDIAGVAVYYRDDTLNTTPADTASYTLVASPKVIQATDSATWRTDEWRTDGVSGSTGVMYGWTSTGHNQGCWFYGEAIQDFVAAHTVTQIYVEYVRDGSSQGMSAASPVMVQVHQHATQPAGAPVYSASGEVAGTAVARVTSPPGDGGYAYLSATQIGLLAGSYKGIHVYDGVANGNTYMRLYPAGHVGDSRTSGEVVISHLG